MRINRFLFIGVWFMFLVLLVVLPGFEVRGLALGLIVGYLPFLGLYAIGFAPEHTHPFLVLFCMLVLSGGYVVGISWFMDRIKFFNHNLVALLIVSVFCFGGFFAFRGSSYESWKGSSAVQQAMYSPEVNYEPTRDDFYRKIVIPRILAGCQVGVYVVLLIAGIVAVGVSLRRQWVEKKGYPAEAAG